jgi:hypothetical protein
LRASGGDEGCRAVFVVELCRAATFEAPSLDAVVLALAVRCVVVLDCAADVSEGC